MRDWYLWAQGSIAITFTAWGQVLSTGWQALIGGMGAIVLALTIWNKILEIQQRRKDLRGE